MTQSVTVAMRCRNDREYLVRTAEAVIRQRHPFEWLAMDNASTDGSREVLLSTADRVIGVPEGSYVPGRILNLAMRESNSEIVVFLNADCEPMDDTWLETLLAPFADSAVAATFGRQVPRPGCAPLAALDTESTYGDGSKQAAWRHCFSMASSAVRRSAWEQVRFDESLSYSEDIAWSWQVKQAGWSIRYVPESKVYHSHNYTAQQWKKRQYGEGRAEAAIFAWSWKQSNLLRYSVMPFLRQMLRDVRYCTRSGHWLALLECPRYRWSQMVGRRTGFIAGKREKRSQSQSMKMLESI